ncbi:MAG TPA: response regulator transcription factor [Ferrovibrio sp.]|jgi:two-component system response regulator ChvI|uniref:response regulator transcription factor n=1 Tax=Ferrovibrio sp. TaxID=1917215 RepID=UPI002B4B3F1D|nr:response regulator transcription factor [Ferrovibrio sp.]HLT77093.1 response regulator transcription factor [Ferrovibrio sp.]
MPLAADSPLVAVVDDDGLFRETISANLTEAGYRSVTFGGGPALIDWLVKGNRAAALLLDWQMPDMDGPATLERLRATGHELPVLFLTGLNQPIFEEKGLRLGAVDFVDKSKSFAIILQRLRIALAGKQPAGGAMQQGGASGLVLDVASARASWNGQQVELTHGEFKVVQLLAQRVGRDVGYREIYDAVRGVGFEAGQGPDGYRANVRAMVKRIRQKFRDLDPDFDAIETYPGFGYRWRHG